MHECVSIAKPSAKLFFSGYVTPAKDKKFQSNTTVNFSGMELVMVKNKGRLMSFDDVPAENIGNWPSAQ